MLDPLCGGGVLPGTSPGHVVRSVAAARAVHPHAHILRADVENFYDSIAWQVALSAAAQAGVDSAALDLLRVFAEAWRGSLRQGVPTSPALAALVVADANRVLRANSVMSACWADDVVAVTLMPGVALGSLEIALASVGLKLNATKSRVLTPLRTVEILGFEITASGSILPGRRALLRLLRDVLNLPSTDRQKRLAAALPYWWLTASAGFSRFDLLQPCGRQSGHPALLVCRRPNAFADRCGGYRGPARSGGQAPLRRHQRCRRSYLLLGSARRAAPWLQSIPPGERDQEWHSLAAVLQLFAGDIGAAVAQAQATAATRLNNPQQIVREAFPVLSNLANFFPVPDARMAALLKAWADAGGDEVRLAARLRIAVLMRGIPVPLLQDALPNLRGTHPLSAAALQTLGGDADGGFAAVDALAFPDLAGSAELLLHRVASGVARSKAGDRVRAERLRVSWRRFRDSLPAPPPPPDSEAALPLCPAVMLARREALHLAPELLPEINRVLEAVPAEYRDEYREQTTVFGPSAG